MELTGTLSLPMPSRTLRIVAVATLVVLNLWGLVFVVRELGSTWYGIAFDWRALTHAGLAPNPFDEPLYRMSPALAPVFGWLAPIGLDAWRLTHVAAVFAFWDRRAIAALLLTFPFWFDFMYGDVLVFVALAGWWAYRGNRVAILIWFVMAALMPRPLMVPLSAWLLWREPWARLPALTIVAIHMVAVLLTGLGDDWAWRLFTSGSELLHDHNLSPSRIIGPLWIPIGIALGAWLTMKGRLGLAAMAVQPYILPYYAMLLTLELRPSRLR